VLEDVREYCKIATSGGYRFLGVHHSFHAPPVLDSRPRWFLHEYLLGRTPSRVVQCVSIGNVLVRFSLAVGVDVHTYFLQEVE
jgi:hypothetical protein